MERTPSPDRAFHPNTSPHKRDQLSGNGEPETRAPIVACHRTIDLHKRLKARLLLCARTANPSIGNQHVQLTPVDRLMCWRERLTVHSLMQGNTEDHFARRGKFDGVADQVDDDLPQTSHITYQPIRDVGLHLVDEF